MGITITISEEVWQKMNQMKEAGQSFDDILRKQFKLKLKGGKKDEPKFK